MLNKLQKIQGYKPSLFKNNRRYSLSGQLLMWLMLFLFIILSVSAVVSYFRAYQFANLAYDRAILRVALALADQADVVNSKIKVDLPQVAEDLLEYDKDDYVSYRISAPSGEIVVGDPDLTPPKLKVPSSDHVYYDDIMNGEKVRVVAYALPIINSKLKGDLLIQVAETREKREFMVREIIGEMLIPQILIMLITALVIYFSVNHSLAPLSRIKNALANRSPNDLSPLLTDNTPQEITPLVDEINALMHRVEEGFDFQKAFIADASHQLRTPLAGLQNQAELALREDVSNSTRHSLQNIAASTQHLSHLVHQLLTLARIEPSTKSNFTFERVDLLNLAREVTAEWVPQAINKGIDLGFKADNNAVMISGNAFMLKEMLANLIDNALCYTPSDGQVTVSVIVKGNHAILHVLDSGIGIAPEKREQVFKRFYRIQDSSYEVSGEGCGLGLAIVKEITNAHGAEITISDGATQSNAKHKVLGCNISVQFNILKSPTSV